jgi:hypothetical protein
MAVEEPPIEEVFVPLRDCADPGGMPLEPEPVVVRAEFGWRLPGDGVGPCPGVVLRDGALPSTAAADGDGIDIAFAVGAAGEAGLVVDEPVGLRDGCGVGVAVGVALAVGVAVAVAVGVGVGVGVDVAGGVWPASAARWAL